MTNTCPSCGAETLAPTRDGPACETCGEPPTPETRAYRELVRAAHHLLVGGHTELATQVVHVLEQVEDLTRG